MKNALPTYTADLPPLELRKALGRNLRKLAEPYRSISSLCREIGINRTQFNRYLAGESFPRSEVLEQMCNFFQVDTQTLLGVSARSVQPPAAINHPFLRDFTAPLDSVSEPLFPSGFYRFTRESFLDTDMVMSGLVQVSRRDGATCVRGFASRVSIRHMGLPITGTVREYRGVVIPQDAGVTFTLTHRRNQGSVFHYLSAISAPEPNLWVGFAARPEHDDLIEKRISRLVYERLGNSYAEVHAAARACGYTPLEDIPEHHQTYLRAGEAFV